jgi:hypothetical protein
MAELTPTPIIEWYGEKKRKEYVRLIGVGV